MNMMPQFRGLPSDILAESVRLPFTLVREFVLSCCLSRSILPLAVPERRRSDRNILVLTRQQTCAIQRRSMKSSPSWQRLWHARYIVMEVIVTTTYCFDMQIESTLASGSFSLIREKCRKEMFVLAFTSARTCYALCDSCSTA